MGKKRKKRYLSGEEITSVLSGLSALQEGNIVIPLETEEDEEEERKEIDETHS
jgi:hypothetical protein